MTTAGGQLSYSLLLLVFLIIVVVLRLDEVPLALSLKGVLEGTVSIACLVGADDGVVPEVIQAHGTANDKAVVGFVIVRDPDADESPEALDERVAAEAGGLLLLSAFSIVREKRPLTQLRSVPEVARSQLGREGSEALLVEVGNKMRHLY